MKERKKTSDFEYSPDEEQEIEENKLFIKKTKNIVKKIKTLNKNDSKILRTILFLYFQNRTLLSTLEITSELSLSPTDYPSFFQSLKILRLEKYIVFYDDPSGEHDFIHPSLHPDIELIESITGTSLVEKEKRETSAFEELTNFCNNFVDNLIEEPMFYPLLNKKIDNLLAEDDKYSLLYQHAETDIEKAMVSFVVMNAIERLGPLDVFDCAEMLHVSYEKSINALKLISSPSLSIVKNNTIVFSLKEDTSAKQFMLNPLIISDLFGKSFVLEDDKVFKTIHKSSYNSSQELFFEGLIKDQIETITNSLKEKTFQKIQTKLNSISLNSGISLLFHGIPGSGKTALAYQLSKNSGRDIYSVDISSVRGKYVGESEKNASKIFEEYEKACALSEIKPILLMNEADAIIGTRGSVNGSADQANNTMQNIFLEKMENFDGILIATTNLIDNLDDAFDRRFLHKIKFDKPNAKTRRLIWKQNIPSLDKKTLSVLESYCLSGGDIVKLVKQFLVKQSINKKVGFDELLIIVKNESNSSSSNSIGFISKK